MHDFTLWTLLQIACYCFVAFVLAKNAIIEGRRFYWLGVAMRRHREVLPHVSKHFSGLSARTIMIICGFVTIGCLVASLSCLRQVAHLVMLG